MAESKVEDVLPFIPECEILEEEGPGPRKLLTDCGCWEKLFPVHDLTINHLPHWLKNEKGLLKIQLLRDATVCIKAKYTSTNRPDTYPDSKAPYPYSEFKGKEGVARVGTGCIKSCSLEKVTDKKCPCHLCVASGSKRKDQYFSIRIRTAAHVVFDANEAKKTTCLVFYDSADTDGFPLYGIDGEPVYTEDGKQKFKTRITNDIFALICVSHDMDLFKKVEAVMKRLESINNFFDVPVIVSHPHGLSKRFGVGTSRFVMLELSREHTLDSRYVLLVGTCVEIDMEVTSEYHGFFQRRYNKVYNTTQPIYIGNITCDSSQLVGISFGYESNSMLISFPNNCKMTSQDGQIQFPQEKFRVSIYDLYASMKATSIHIKYDIPTCKGSSGARFDAPVTGGFPNRCHFGKLPDGMNRTEYYVNPPSWHGMKMNRK